MAHASLTNVAYNQSVNNKNIRLCESGRVYLPKSLPLGDFPQENDYVSLVACEDGYDFFKLKGVVEGLLALTSIDYNLERYCNETRALGGIPILMNCVARRNFAPKSDEG